MKEKLKIKDYKTCVVVSQYGTCYECLTEYLKDKYKYFSYLEPCVEGLVETCTDAQLVKAILLLDKDNKYINEKYRKTFVEEYNRRNKSR